MTKEATETAMGEKEHTCTETAEIAKQSSTDAVQTGDNRNLTLWFALFTVSVTGMYSKRKRSSWAK